MELESGLKTINEVRVEMGLETVPYGNTPLSLQVEETTEPIDTGNQQLDNAFELIRESKSNLYRNFDYLNGGLL